MSTRQEIIANRISEVRQKDVLLHLELYCDGDSDCPVRTIEVHLKDYDDDTMLSMVRARSFRCPLCGTEAKMHWVRTGQQQHKTSEEFARCSVNMQMSIRDQKAERPDGLGVVSAVTLCDDRLPPTPEGWFDANHQTAPSATTKP